MGTPKSQLRQFEKALLDEADWHTVREGLEVKLVAAPDGTSTERYVLCRSQDRGAKERAMLNRQIERLRGEFAKLDADLGLGLPQRTKWVPNVVPKNASNSPQVSANQAKHFPD